MKRILTFLAILLVITTAVFAAEQPLLEENAVWDYLETGSDPAAGNADRTAWTREDYSLSADWKQGAQPLGGRRGDAFLQTGYTAKTVLAGSTGSDNVPAYFFRTTFEVENPAGMDHLRCTVVHDDAAIVYINGIRVAAFEDVSNSADGTALNTPIDSNLCYGGEAIAEPRTDTFYLEDLSCLKSGENVIAVEVHQLSASSSDIWFSVPELTLADEPRDLAITDIVLNPGADESAMNFTWFYPEKTAGALYICPAEDLVDGGMPEDAAVYSATAAITNEKLYTNKATAVGLQPDTVYAYRLKSGIQQTAVRTFRTAPEGDFAFAFTGDPQLGSIDGDAALWAHTLNLIAEDPLLADVRFLVTAGDQVNRCFNEAHYDAFLASPVMRALPVAVSIGNHDNTTFGLADNSLVASYSQHFNLPNNTTGLGDSAAGCDYWFACNDVLFFMLNGNSLDFEEHRQLMEQAIAAEPDARWRIVVTHQSLYSVANHSSDADVLQRRAEFAPIFHELGVDLVLMGHDHTYCRTYLMDGTTPITDPAAYDDETMTSATDTDGILYITGNSAGGNRNYNIKDGNFPYAAVKNQEYIGNVSCIEVTDRTLTITTYRTTDMTVMDAFTLRKTDPAADLEDAIDALEEPTVQQVLELLEAYDTLTSEQQEAVRNYGKLEAAAEELQEKLTQEALIAARTAAETAEAASEAASGAQAAADEAQLLGDASAMEHARRAQEAAGKARSEAEKAGSFGEEASASADLAAAAEAHEKALAAAAAAETQAASARAAAGEAAVIRDGLLTGLQSAKAKALAELSAKADSVRPTTEEQKNRIKTICREAEAAIATAQTELAVQQVLQQALEALENSGCPSEGFRDIPADAWFHNAVDHVLRNGIMSGDGDDTFDPDQPLSRAMLVQILYNMAGKPAHNGSITFRDVPKKEWYYDAVTWAAEQGLVSGYGEGLFGPEDTLTREQLVSVLWRRAGSPLPGSMKSGFADSGSISKYARHAVLWATEAGLVSGVGGNRFDPTGACTRAQTAQVILKMSE